MKKMILLAAALAAASASLSTTAHAGGWIATHIIKPIAGAHAAREADKLHERWGKPGDKVINAAKAAAAAAAAGAVMGK